MSSQLRYLRVKNSLQTLQNIFLTSSTRWMPFSIFGGKFLHLVFTLLHTASKAFCSVWNCTSLVLCCFSWSSISFSQILGTEWPYLKKTIQGSMHLICIMNRLRKWATFERKQNKHSNEEDGRGLLIIKVVFTCRSPQATKAWLPWILWNTYFLCSLIILQAYLKLERQIVGDKKQSYAEK